MSHSKNPGFATIPGATILYLWQAPPPAMLTEELRVLEHFLQLYNANTPCADGKLPSKTRAPPLVNRILVTKANHPSNSEKTAHQGERITALLCTEEGWNAPRRSRGACAHVFSVGDEPANGFKEFRIHEGKLVPLTSASMVQQIKRAAANNMGSLVGGFLVGPVGAVGPADSAEGAAGSAGAEDAAGPADAEDAAGPADAEDAAGPADAEDVVRPADAEDAAGPRPAAPGS